MADFPQAGSLVPVPQNGSTSRNCDSQNCDSQDCDTGIVTPRLWRQMLRLSISTAMHTVKYCAVTRFCAGATIFWWHATIL